MLGMGFEPMSKARKAFMIGRTTPTEQKRLLVTTVAIRISVHVPLHVQLLFKPLGVVFCTIDSISRFHIIKVMIILVCKPHGRLINSNACSPNSAKENVPSETSRHPSIVTSCSYKSTVITRYTSPCWWFPIPYPVEP